MDSDGGEARRLTFDGAYNTNPAWSPDGLWIAYETRVDGQFDIWLIDPEGKVNVPLVTNERSDEAPSWAPNSRHIVFSSTRRGSRRSLHDRSRRIESASPHRRRREQHRSVLGAVPAMSIGGRAMASKHAIFRSRGAARHALTLAALAASLASVACVTPAEFRKVQKRVTDLERAGGAQRRRREHAHRRLRHPARRAESPPPGAAGSARGGGAPRAGGARRGACGALRRVAPGAVRVAGRSRRRRRGCGRVAGDAATTAAAYAEWRADNAAGLY